MKKVMILLATTSLLAACGGPQMMPNAQMMGARPQPLMMAQNAAMQQPNQIGVQSITGIYKELQRSIEANFAAKDGNKDGTITPNEFPVESPEDFNHFRRLDSNRDGQLSKGEMSTGFLGKAVDIFQIKATASFVFHELDADGNKRLTKTEAGASRIPGVAANFDSYLTKVWWSGKQRDYLRKTDFENLMAFALTNPGAANGVSAEYIPDEVIAQ
ncbi:MAG: hypothetical protein IGS03_05245 [Candidatus Sericytochromatia bacterium]|nr:hypothetical protein [Candidatus Sericytochromatia bacterium]